MLLLAAFDKCRGLMLVSQIPEKVWITVSTQILGWHSSHDPSENSFPGTTFPAMENEGWTCKTFV
jgi:hypothetical protein